MSRTVMRLPNAEKWNAGSLASVSVSPWNLHKRREPTVVFGDRIDEPVASDAPKPRLARRIYIGKKDLERFGRTAGCPKCDHELRYGPGRTTANHSEECRRRIELELAKSEEGQERIARATVRLDRAVAEAGAAFRNDGGREQQPIAQGESVEGVRKSAAGDHDPFDSFKPRVVDSEPHDDEVEPRGVDKPCEVVGEIDESAIREIDRHDEPVNDPSGDVDMDVVDVEGASAKLNASQSHCDRAVDRAVSARQRWQGHGVGGTRIDRASDRPNFVRSAEDKAGPAEGTPHPSPAVDSSRGLTTRVAGHMVEPEIGKRQKWSTYRCGDKHGKNVVSIDYGDSKFPPPGGSSVVAVSSGQSSSDGGDELSDALNGLYREEMRKDDAEILSVICQLGGSSDRYLRERRRAAKHIVSEIYSPPRVTAAAKLFPELRCVPGFAMDRTTNDEHGRPWDFDDARQRRRARELLEAQRPMLLVGSPMCTAFSAWQHTNNKKRDPTVVSREYVRHGAYEVYDGTLQDAARGWPLLLA